MTSTEKLGVNELVEKLNTKEDEIVELEKENVELKTKKIPQLERKIASIRGCHSVDAKKLNARIEQVERLKKENAELLCQKNRNKSCYSCANATERCFRNEIGCPCQKYKSYTEENAELKAYNEKLLDGDIEKHNKIVELKAQIEKMKCCGNCEHFNFSEPNYCHKGVYRERQYVCSEWKFGN